MDEKELLIKLFAENFSGMRSKKIAIYGISLSTKIILENCKGVNVLGLMDGYLTNGEIYGKPVLSQNDVVNMGIKVIVVVARASSVKIITRRISEFCQRYGIALYDINGVDLLERYAEPVFIHDPCFAISAIDLQIAISKHDIISFDIFDTLIMRKVLYPTDVFSLTAQRIDMPLSKNIDYQKCRREAEAELLAGDYPSINMIYELFRRKSGLTDAEANYLKELELSAEQEVLIPRLEMVQIFNETRKNGKQVYLISDMYITKDKLEKILYDCGITGYSDIFVSCEYGTTKTGSLFKEFKNKVDGTSYLHIGDNYEADILAAEKHGIDSFRIFSACHMLGVSKWRDILKSDGEYVSRVMIGLFVSHVFNSPFALFNTNGKICINDSFDAAWLFIAPLVSTFIHWLLRKLAGSNYDKILFFARDGFLVEQLYRMAIEREVETRLPESRYFLTSRVACLVATIFEEKDILKIISMGFDGPPEMLLEKRFLLERKDIVAYRSDCYESIEEYILSHKSKILATAEQNRAGYKKYIEIENIMPTDKLAVFDLAASGTCQCCLHELIPNEIDGFYFVYIKSNDDKMRSLDISSLYKIDSWFKKEAFICESYILMESVLTSFEGSLEGFDINGEPRFANEYFDTEHSYQILLMQQAIKEYFCEYLPLIARSKPTIDTADKLLSFIQNRYTDITRLPIFNDSLHDGFYNRSYCFRDVLE